jgi:hypothetical protein
MGVPALRAKRLLCTDTLVAYHRKKSSAPRDTRGGLGAPTGLLCLAALEETSRHGLTDATEYDTL